MRRQHRSVAFGVAFALLTLLRPSPDARGASQGQSLVSVPLEVVALEPTGAPADSLTPGSLAVTVDGKPRRVLWIRRVSRGPGSVDEAGRRQSDGRGALRFAAEPARSVLVVIDQTSIERGSERNVIEAAAALLDRLGFDDRVGVVRIPIPRDGHLALTTERAAMRSDLRRVAGLATPAGALPSVVRPAPPAPVSDENRAAGDPETVSSPERPQIDTDRPGSLSGEGVPPAADVFTNLRDILQALRPFPTRKVVAVFSGGLRSGGEKPIDELSREAIAAHATIYAFESPGNHDDRSAAPALSALARLAASTGGSATVVGKNADKAIETMVSEISACFVLSVERVRSDDEGTAHRLRVDGLRQRLVVRAPAWFVPGADLEDLMPPSPPPRPAPAEPVVPAKEAAAAPARDLELQRVVARASSYVAGYEREYSMLVAEEQFVQSTRAQVQSIRSDLLLVRPQGAERWMSFRDVFEVDGKAVRDRDDRLRRLFLDPSVEARAQLTQIAAESARYNIGAVERNVNVPLLPLKFLRSENLERFRFKLLGRENVGGVSAVRMSYDEHARPTLVELNKVNNLPARGWFLIDAASGAVIASRMEFELSAGSIELEVRYARDATLGMWLPAEMTEVHWADAPNGVQSRTMSVDARATYSKFRRFQVTTDAQVRIQK